MPGVRPGHRPGLNAALLAVALAALLPAVVGTPVTTRAQDSAPDGRPFGLPFAAPPGPGSWYVAQSFGNTVFAYFERHGLYRSAQGMHMGLDLATPCGTPVLAIGDGTVLSVDGRGGSPPHNLMIRHPNGYVSFYGHLLERPAVAVGQAVARGQPVALSGDMYGTCRDSPHLHLEIRDGSLNRLFNPVDFVAADWHSILLLGTSTLSFERDLDDPRRWQAIDRQPELRIGGGVLNDFANAWPADRR
jgi:murein DD-endopeptidase MepM/ murein hydrolase activator NlpD